MKDDIFAVMPAQVWVPEKEPMQKLLVYLESRFREERIIMYPMCLGIVDTSTFDYVFKFGDIQYNQVYKSCELIIQRDSIVLNIGSGGTIDTRVWYLLMSQGNLKTGIVFESWIDAVKLLENNIFKWFQYKNLMYNNQDNRALMNKYFNCIYTDIFSNTEFVIDSR